MSHPNWWIALRIARAVLPGTTILHKVDDLAGLERCDWVGLDLERSDAEIWGEIAERVKDGLRGLLVVITDVSYSTAGPLLIDAADLDLAVAEHFDLFSDCFFAGDAIIICPASGRVAIVHHENRFGFLEGESTRAWRS